MKKGSSDGGGPLCHDVTSPRTAGSHPQAPFLKFSVLNFPPDRAQPMLNKHGLFIAMRPIWGKIKIKSLWKGVRGRPFPQKGFPRVIAIYFCMNTTLKTSGLFCVI